MNCYKVHRIARNTPNLAMICPSKKQKKKQAENQNKISLTIINKCCLVSENSLLYIVSCISKLFKCCVLLNNYLYIRQNFRERSLFSCYSKSKVHNPICTLETFYGILCKIRVKCLDFISNCLRISIVIARNCLSVKLLVCNAFAKICSQQRWNHHLLEVC